MLIPFPIILLIAPSDGFQLQLITDESKPRNVWDIGGQEAIRPYWSNYFENTDAPWTKHGITWLCEHDSMKLHGIGPRIRQLHTLMRKPWDSCRAGCFLYQIQELGKSHLSVDQNMYLDSRCSVSSSISQQVFFKTPKVNELKCRFTHLFQTFPRKRWHPHPNFLSSNVAMVCIDPFRAWSTSWTLRMCDVWKKAAGSFVRCWVKRSWPGFQP